MNKKFQILLLFIIYQTATSAFGQGTVIDSLSALLKTDTRPIEQIDLLNEIAALKIRNNGNLDSISLQKAIDLANKHSYQKGLATALKNKGIWSIINSQYDRAEALLISSQKIFKSLGDAKMIAKLDNNLSILYKDIGKYEKALEKLNSYSTYAESNGDSTLLAKAYNNLGSVHRHMGENQKAIDMYVKCLVLDSLMNNTRGEVITSINLAELYRDNGELSKAVPMSLKALKKAQQLDLDNVIFWSLTTVGLIYKDIENYNKSLSYLSLASKKAIDMDVNKLIGASYSNLSQVYEFINLDSAIIYLEKAKNLPQNPPNYLASILINLGGILNEKKKDYMRAKSYFNQALEISEEIKNQPLIDLANYNIGNLYFFTEEYDKSIHHYEQVIESVKKSDDLEFLKIVYRSIAEPYYANKQWEEGKESIDNFALVLDSLLTEERATTKVLMDYEVEKQKHLDEIKIQEKSIKIQQRNYTLLGLGLGAFFILIFALQRNKIAKTEAKRARIEAEKAKTTEVMGAELHHRVRNNLATFSSMMSIKGSAIKDDSANEALSSIQDRIIALEKIHTRLYKGNNALEVEIISFLNNLTNELITMNNYEEDVTDIHVEINGDNQEIPSTDAIEIGKILNEIITNAFKHALNNNPNPKITVNGNINNSVLHLSIANNGNPLPENFKIDELNSFGLKWVKGICDSKEWEYNYQNKNKEVRFEFKIPLK